MCDEQVAGVVKNVHHLNRLCTISRCFQCSFTWCCPMTKAESSVRHDVSLSFVHLVLSAC